MPEPEDGRARGAAEVSAVAALDEPTRRRLYEYVVRQPAASTRDDAAAAVGVPRSTAVFHLDRLVEQGLLDVVHERRSGRSGPGAGRPSKLYRRSSREVSVSVPGRRYDLAGELLAGALDEAEASGASPREVLARRAHRVGRRIAAAARATGASVDTRRLVLEALESHGYEPRADEGEIVLANCPFHALVERHTDLVCGMNLHLLDGLVEELASASLSARLDPSPGRCCVVLSDGEH
jgi:predicted ArsR family transcriptional regulator